MELWSCWGVVLVGEWERGNGVRSPPPRSRLLSRAPSPEAPRFLTPVSLLPQPGKVHGSLARAGKVKGQTPKVEKEDKKKKPRGRAFKRFLYNRRFVNVVVGPGKKRSPNSNSE